MSWTYDGAEVKSIPEGFIGFVYIIECPTGHKYIGKKLCISNRKKVIKGRNRRVLTETDWATYCGSSEEIKLLVKAHGLEKFNRQILHWCKDKSSMAYMEMKEIFDRDALLKDDYLNKWVTAQINGKNLKSLRPVLTNSKMSYITLLDKQEPLGGECQKVLNENRWDLYDNDVKSILED